MSAARCRACTAPAPRRHARVPAVFHPFAETQP